MPEGIDSDSKRLTGVWPREVLQDNLEKSAEGDRASQGYLPVSALDPPFGNPSL